jgi:hypothetical protein
MMARHARSADVDGPDRIALVGSIVGGVVSLERMSDRAFLAVIEVWLVFMGLQFLLVPG